MPSETDPRIMPASIVQAALRDPARGTGAPPNFGMDVVPHIHTASGRFGVASKSYLNMDEALQDSRENAQRMRAAAVKKAATPMVLCSENVCMATAAS